MQIRKRTIAPFYSLEAESTYIEDEIHDVEMQIGEEYEELANKDLTD